MSLAGTILPVMMVLVGVAIAVRTVAGGGGPLAQGLLIGALFVAAGAARMYVERSRR